MKTRTSFVANSSSCSFIIKNTSTEPKTLVDFVRENPEILDKFLAEFDWYQNRENEHFTLATMIEEAKEDSTVLQPGEDDEFEFGDNHGPYSGQVIGHVYDYMLRDGGESESFTWHMVSMNR
jgi:hypothetical protein